MRKKLSENKLNELMKNIDKESTQGAESFLEDLSKVYSDEYKLTLGLDNGTPRAIKMVQKGKEIIKIFLNPVNEFIKTYETTVEERHICRMATMIHEAYHIKESNYLDYQEFFIKNAKMSEKQLNELVNRYEKSIAFNMEYLKKTNSPKAKNDYIFNLLKERESNNKKVNINIARGLGNAAEDGRIEFLSTLERPKYKGYLKFSNDTYLEHIHEAKKDNRVYNLLVGFCSLCIANKHIRNLKDVDLEIYKKLEIIRPYIKVIRYSSSTNKALRVVEKIIDKLYPLIEELESNKKEEDNMNNAPMQNEVPNFANKEDENDNSESTSGMEKQADKEVEENQKNAESDEEGSEGSTEGDKGQSTPEDKNQSNESDADGQSSEDSTEGDKNDSTPEGESQGNESNADGQSSEDSTEEDKDDSASNNESHGNDKNEDDNSKTLANPEMQSSSDSEENTGNDVEFDYTKELMELAKKDLNDIKNRDMKIMKNKTLTEKEISENFIKDDIYVLGDFEYKKLDAKGLALSELKDRCKNQINILTKSLEKILKPKQNQTITHRKSGSLDSKRLLDLVTYLKTDIFYKKNTPSKELSFAFKILNDCSGSTRSIINQIQDCSYTISQSLLNLKMNIPCKVVGFNSDLVGVSKQHGNIKVNNSNKITHFEGKDWNEKTCDRISGFKSGGNNADGISIRISGTELLQRKEDVKIMFVISDGQPVHQTFVNNKAFLKNSIDDTRIAVNELKKEGIVVIGVYIGDDLSNVAKTIYGNNCVVVNRKESDNLAYKVSNVLKSELRKVKNFS